MSTFRIAFVILVLGIGLVPVPAMAQSGSISGVVRDAGSGETLILANVVLENTTIGAATNTSGFYSLANVPVGTYSLVCSYIGYEQAVLEVVVEDGSRIRLDIELRAGGLMVGEVVVSADRDVYDDARRVGVAQMKTDLVRRIPSVLEADVFRSLQLLPGIKAASDYSSGLYIRGGSPDQTLILLDRTTVYNPSHFFGFFSTFNPDAVKDVRVYRGAYPAQYGGRLGSVVDIYNKDGNRNRTAGRVSLGLLASRAMVEGPYKWGSWMLAVRRSTLEPLLSVLKNQDVEGVPESFYFVDANGKLNIDASPDDRISLTFYAGKDDLKLPFLDDAGADLSYGNRTVSANWTHISSSSLFSTLTLTASRYFSEPSFVIGGTEISRRNDVYDVSAQAGFEYAASDHHIVTGGVWGGVFTFRLRDSFDRQETLSERTQSPYGGVYIEDMYRPSLSWTIRAGVRASYFDEGSYLRLEPRLSVERAVSEHLRVKTGYGRYYQFLTLVTSELFTGSDLWLTTDEGVPPAHGDQFVLGLEAGLRPDLRLELEGYYRSMRSLFEIDPRLPDAAGLEYEDLFLFGDGYAYGAEVLLEKTRGRLSGLASYTAGVTRRRFPDFPSPGDFEFFPPKYDRTHDFKLVATYALSRRWQLTGAFTYATGQAYTRPEGQFWTVDKPVGSEIKNVLVSPFNQARLPSYHRLDLGASLLGRFFGIGDYELQLQVLNLYARRNVWFYFYDFEKDGTIGRTTIPQIPVPLPNISFTVTF